MSGIRNAFFSTALMIAVGSGSVTQTAVAGDAGSAFVGGLLGGAAGSAATNIYFENKREKERAAAASSSQPKTVYSSAAPAASDGVQVQNALTSLGYYAGPLDGNLDSYESRSAVMSYQSQYGLPQTGLLQSDVKSILKYQGEVAELSGHLNYLGFEQLEKNKRLQSGLKVQGYYTAKVDGVVGRGTQNAVRLYQQANGLPITGVLTPDEEAELVSRSLQTVQAQQAQSDEQLAQVAARYQPQAPVAQQSPENQDEAQAVPAAATIKDM